MQILQIASHIGLILEYAARPDNTLGWRKSGKTRREHILRRHLGAPLARLATENVQSNNSILTKCSRRADGTGGAGEDVIEVVNAMPAALY